MFSRCLMRAARLATLALLFSQVGQETISIFIPVSVRFGEQDSCGAEPDMADDYILTDFTDGGVDCLRALTAWVSDASLTCSREARNIGGKCPTASPS
jgi:hypothetical protein